MFAAVKCIPRWSGRAGMVCVITVLPSSRRRLRNDPNVIKVLYIFTPLV
jgi:hypothetical protein